MNLNQKRIYLQTHKPLQFKFEQNQHDFIVEELPIPFKNKGNFLILKIKKRYTSTWNLLSIISQKLDILENMIGYAGLKDANATTTQYISIPLHKSRDYNLLNSKNIEILDTFKHDQKLKIGDLLGNRFKITLKNVDQEDLGVIYQTLSQIQKHGMPNYFGYQRFGKENNFEHTKAVAYGQEILSDKKLQQFLVGAYQSYFFNAWLCKRVQLSQEGGFKKLLPLNGDIYSIQNKSIITGLLPGRKIVRATQEAGILEQEFDDPFIHDKGYRRDAWITPANIKNKYIQEDNWLELQFDLPKSSYATVFIENLANKNLGFNGFLK